jgi:hypothetical protein
MEGIVHELGVKLDRKQNDASIQATLDHGAL